MQIVDCPEIIDEPSTDCIGGCGRVVGGGVHPAAVGAPLRPLPPGVFEQGPHWGTQQVALFLLQTCRNKVFSIDLLQIQPKKFITRRALKKIACCAFFSRFR